MAARMGGVGGNVAGRRQALRSKINISNASLQLPSNSLAGGGEGSSLQECNRDKET